MTDLAYEPVVFTKDDHLLTTEPESQEESRELLQLREQVSQLTAERAAKEAQLRDLLRVAEHVRAQEAARRAAEEKLKMAEHAAEADAAEKDRRYNELFHMVCQVDREVALRREAERRLETATASAREAVAKSQEEALAAQARAAEAEERASVLEEGRLQLEARLAEKEAQLAPLRSQLAKATQSASENRILSNSLQDQLASVVKTSEARAAACAEAKARCSAAEQQTLAARQEAQRFTARITAVEKDYDDVREQLDAARRGYADLQKAYDEAGGVLCERFGEAKRTQETVESLHNEVEALQSEASELRGQLKRAQVETADWTERAMVAASQLAEGQSKAVSTFLRKFPAAAAVTVLFKHLLSRTAETLEEAVRQRLCLHGLCLSRHELNQFLTDFAGLRGVELNVVAQSIFGAMDLEREGQVPQDLLLQRLDEPPSMKEVWLADLDNLWPGRDAVIQYARRESPPQTPDRVDRRQPSRRSRPGSAATAPGAFRRDERHDTQNGAWPMPSPPSKPCLAKRPGTAVSTRNSRRDQEGLRLSGSAREPVTEGRQERKDAGRRAARSEQRAGSKGDAWLESRPMAGTSTKIRQLQAASGERHKSSHRANLR
ncbi:unnamed protein product [Effrenium voratum]|uniref:Uncharacterized protein n=1 Tax=Effrenium voratum TaxID=2562239 RepID=A0AA36MTH3_9DINO|nr:unnamed protein product [Effrenium voratum]